MSLRHAGSIRYNIQLKSRFNPKHKIQSRSYHEKSAFLNSTIKQFYLEFFFRERICTNLQQGRTIKKLHKVGSCLGI